MSAIRQALALDLWCLVMPSELNSTLSTIYLLGKAREAETEGNLEEAASLYEQIIQEDNREEFPFDRLMIIYRKLKKYKDELKIIIKGIRVFEDLYKKPTKKSEKQQKLATLSNAFMKKAGLNDKKGNPVYVPEPIARWMKRKAVVEKKLK